LGLNDDEEAELDDLDEDTYPDQRSTERRRDKKVEKNGEYYDSDDDMEDERPGRPKTIPGRDMENARTNFRNIMDVGRDSGLDTGSGVGTPLQGSSLPDDEMHVDEPQTEAQTPDPTHTTNGSGAVSGAMSPQRAADADEDVAMGEADGTDGVADVTTAATAEIRGAEEATVSQQITPPKSPVQDTPAVAAPSVTAAETTEEPSHAAPAETEGLQAVKQEMDAEDQAIAAEEEGRMEREQANADGEANTEAATKAEATT